MFRAWHAAEHRPTMDIDLLGRTTNSVENLENICRELCDQKTLPQDGMSFSSKTVRGVLIQTEAEYEGIRIEFGGELNKAVIHMQIDIGFGDIITPNSQILSYPTILDLPAPQLQGYTVESVIAEKLETMVKRGIANSRMKDFFDIWTLSKQFSINTATLAKAIQATFNQRGCFLDPSPECFTENFALDAQKNAQWKSFIHKSRLTPPPGSLASVVEQISAFLTPILEQLSKANTQ